MNYCFFSVQKSKKHDIYVVREVDLLVQRGQKYVNCSVSSLRVKRLGFAKSRKIRAGVRKMRGAALSEIGIGSGHGFHGLKLALGGLNGAWEAE